MAPPRTSTEDDFNITAAGCLRKYWSSECRTCLDYPTEPRLVTLRLGAEEVEQVNAITQVYACDFLFYRDDKPELSNAFQHGEHRQFQYHRHHWLDPLLDKLSQYNR